MIISQTIGLILTNHGPVVGRNDFLGAGRQLDPGLFRVVVVGDHSGVVARGTGQSTTISSLFFQVAYDGTFRHSADGKDISYKKKSS